MKSRLIEEVQVNIPFRKLKEVYLERFIQDRINPEIGLDARALDKCSHSEFRAISDRLHAQSLKITLHAPFMDLSPGSADPKVWSVTRIRFEQTLEAVRIFQPRTVVCHTGYDEKRYGGMKALWLERSLAFWSWFGKEVISEGAAFVLENVYEKTPRDLEVLFDHLKEFKPGFCLDTGHQAVFASEPIDSWVESMQSHLVQLHLHDNTGMRDEHLGLGRGTVDFPGLLNGLKSIRKEPPFVTLEPHREEDLWTSLRYLERVWPW